MRVRASIVDKVGKGRWPVRQRKKKSNNIPQETKGGNNDDEIFSDTRERVDD